jgi:APA family basic amino acid/polyamine antiporter
LVDSTSIVVGSMIGSGIFIVSAEISRTVGAPGWLLVVWLVAGLMTVVAALSYGELAGMFPAAGGKYVYLREAYNPLVGFLYGWTSFMVIQSGSIAAVAMAFAKYTGVLLPWFNESHILLDLGRFKFNAAQLLAIASILLTSFYNSRGVRLGKIIQNTFTTTKVAALAGFIILGLIIASPAAVREANRAVFWDASTVTGGSLVDLAGFALVAALGAAMVGSLFAADAWYNLTFTGEEVHNPRKTIPRSLFLGTLIVCTIYLLANIIYLKFLPVQGAADGADAIARGMQHAQDDRIGTAAMEVMIGSYAAVLMAIFIIISTFGCNNGLILSSARVYYAMAVDNLFFRKVARLNRFGVPGNALMFQGTWSALLCLSGTYTQLLDYIVFAVLIFFVLAIAGVFVLRVRRPDAERPYRAFGYPVVQVIYILVALMIMGILLVHKPDYTWPGLIIVVAGVPVFWLWRRFGKR